MIPRLSVAADGFQGIEEGLFPAGRSGSTRLAAEDRYCAAGTDPDAEGVWPARLHDRRDAPRRDAPGTGPHPGPHSRRLRLAAGAPRPRGGGRRHSPGSAISRWLVAPDSATRERSEFLVELERTTRALKGADWDTFDRLAFYRDRVPPLSRALAQFRVAAHIAPPATPAFGARTPSSVFEAGAFDPYAPSGADGSVAPTRPVSRRVEGSSSTSGHLRQRESQLRHLSPAGARLHRWPGAERADHRVAARAYFVTRRPSSTAASRPPLLRPPHRDARGTGR